MSYNVQDFDLVKGDQVNVYEFIVNNSYAHFYVDNVNGTLLINSGWGDYCHRWGRGGNRCYSSFYSFLADCDASYILTKLSYGNRQMLREFDLEESIKYLKNTTLEMRKDKSISFNEARFCWNRLDCLMNSEDNDVRFYDAIKEECSFSDYINDEDDEFTEGSISEILHEYEGNFMHYSPTPQVKFLSNALLPMFLEKLKELYSGKELSI